MLLRTQVKVSVTPGYHLREIIGRRYTNSGKEATTQAGRRLLVQIRELSPYSEGGSISTADLLVLTG